MILKNIRPFGRFIPGDVLEIPDGSIFDTYHFVKEVEAVKETPKPVAKESVPDTKPVKE